MLRSLIVHYKNVLFFKTIIYILAIIGLLILVPISKNGLERAVKKRENAELFLDRATIRLSSLKDFEENINAINLRYIDLIKAKGKDGCIKRNNFIENISNLTRDKNRFSDISTEINKIEDNKPHHKNGLKTMLYNAEVKFNTMNYEDFFDFGYKLHNVLPTGYFITSVEIRDLQSLSPDIIDQLTIYAKPKLHKVNIKLLLHDIIYDR